MNKLDLIKKVKEVTVSGLAFMEGKEKTDLADGELYNVKEYGYMKGDKDAEFVVVSDGETFAFGGAVVTEAFRKLDEQLSEKELEELLEEGIPMLIAKKKSKNKRTYTTCEFFPEQ